MLAVLAGGAAALVCYLVGWYRRGLYEARRRGGYVR